MVFSILTLVATTTIQRFWKQASASPSELGWKVLLDGRPLKTPSGKVVEFPQNKSILAHLLAAEWDSQPTFLKPYSLPITSIVYRSFDGLVEHSERQRVLDALFKFFNSDTLL